LLQALHDGLESAVGLGPGAEELEHVLEDGPLAQGVDLLGEIADRALAVAQEVARVERLLADEDLEQRRLPGPVLAEQADALAPVDGGVDAVVDGLASVVLAGVDQADHGEGDLGGSEGLSGSGRTGWRACREALRRREADE